jgi:GNAT superfamily N-acetyltransferase
MRKRPFSARAHNGLKIAEQSDLERTVQALTGHMSRLQRWRFREKLLRYIQKSDRDLILYMLGSNVVGCTCVIERARLPVTLPSPVLSRLEDFACGTALLVRPEFRRRGIGAQLQRGAEKWARRRGRLGYWLVTHRMADWHRRHFGYEFIGSVWDNKTEKTVMAKSFASEPPEKSPCQ